MTDKVSLATLRGGAAIELVDTQIDAILENIVDPNRPADATRKITLTLTFAPNESREMFGLRMDVKTTLAPPAGHDATVFISHTRDGVVALEHDPKQQNYLHDEPPADVEQFPTEIEGGTK